MLEVYFLQIGKKWKKTAKFKKIYFLKFKKQNFIIWKKKKTNKTSKFGKKTTNFEKRDIASANPNQSTVSLYVDISKKTPKICNNLKVVKSWKIFLKFEKKPQILLHFLSKIVESFFQM